MKANAWRNEVLYYLRDKEGIHAGPSLFCEEIADYPYITFTLFMNSLYELQRFTAYKIALITPLKECKRGY